MERNFRVLCTVFVIFILTVKLCVACSSSSYRSRKVGLSSRYESSGDTMAEAVQRAEASIEDNKVTLPFAHPSQSGCQNIVRQFAIGETVAVSCTPEPELGDIAREYMWKHNDKLIQTSSHPDFSRYTVNSVGNAVFLYIQNITFYDSGIIECFKRCRNGTSEFCLMKEYTLRPKPRGLRDIFAQTHKNVSVFRSTQPTFTCAVKFPCVPDTEQHFIWKYNGVFILGPLDHSIHNIRQQRRSGVEVNFTVNAAGPNSDVPYCQQTVTLRFKWPSSDAGIVECWARPDRCNEEWFVQKTHLQFS